MKEFNVDKPSNPDPFLLEKECKPFNFEGFTYSLIPGDPLDKIVLKGAKRLIKTFLKPKTF